MDTLNIMGELSLSYPSRKWSADDERWEVVGQAPSRLHWAIFRPAKLLLYNRAIGTFLSGLSLEEFRYCKK